jgi:hypothetical protein
MYNPCLMRPLDRRDDVGADYQCISVKSLFVTPRWFDESTTTATSSS